VPGLRASKNEGDFAGTEKAAGRNGSLERLVELKSLGSHCPLITRRILVSKIRKPELPSPALGLFWPPHLVASWGAGRFLKLLAGFDF
jgi:hypothetical protein